VTGHAARLAGHIALLASSGAAFLVLLLYAPALEAPFLVPKLAALEVTGSLGVLALVLRRASSQGARWDRRIALGVLLVLLTTAAAWAGASAPCPYAVDAMARWCALFGIACGASVVEQIEDGARHVLETVAIAATAIAGIGLLQHLGVLPFTIPVFSLPGSTFGNRNIAAEAMAMSLPLAWPLVAGSARRHARVLAWVAILFELLFLAVTRARGAWVGAALGLAVMFWLERRRLSRRRVLGALGALVIAGVVAALPGRWTPHDAGDTKRYVGAVGLLEQSVDVESVALRTRRGIWRRTVAMVTDHPWLGVGPGNWPVAFPTYAEPEAARDGVLTATLAPRQAHDDLLERAAETGIPGLFALLLLVAAISLAAKRRLQTGDPQQKALVAAAAGSLVALIGTSVASFPFEMPGTIVLAGLALGFLARDERASSPPVPRAWSVPALAATLILVAFALVRAERNVRSSLAFGAAERALHREHGAAGATEALAALEHSLDVKPGAFGPELRAAQMWLRLDRPADALASCQRALASEPHSPNAFATLAASYLAAGDSPSAIRAATLALGVVHDYPFALDVRAKAEDHLAKTADAEADRLRLRRLVTDASDDETRQRAGELSGEPRGTTER